MFSEYIPYKIDIGDIFDVTSLSTTITRTKRNTSCTDTNLSTKSTKQQRVQKVVICIENDLTSDAPLVLKLEKPSYKRVKKDEKNLFVEYSKKSSNCDQAYDSINSKNSELEGHDAGIFDFNGFKHDGFYEFESSSSSDCDN